MSSATAGALRDDGFEVKPDDFRESESRSPVRTDARPIHPLLSGATTVSSSRREESEFETPRYDPRAAVSDRDARALYREYGELVDKETLHGLSKSESVRLRYLSWQIDRLEMAELGPSFERLSQLAQLQRSAALAIDELTTAVRHVRRGR